MEKRQVNDIYRLFVIVFFFVTSILLLNNQKKKAEIATHVDFSNATGQAIINLSVDQAYHHMNSLFISHDIDLVIKVINQCMHQFTIELVEKIISDDRYFLSQEEKMKILFGTAAYCASKKSMSYRLFDFLLKYPYLYERVPALLVLMRNQYTDCLSPFINWGKERQKSSGRKNLLAQFIEHSFTVAIEGNDYKVIEHMFDKKVRISREKASEFLWTVVKKSKSHHFVSLLVKYGQADVNSVHKRKTLLIEAVEQDNKAMVQALLDQGVVVDRIIDPKKGTALQVAMARKYNATETLLREYGA